MKESVRLLWRARKKFYLQSSSSLEKFRGDARASAEGANRNFGVPPPFRQVSAVGVGGSWWDEADFDALMLSFHRQPIPRNSVV